ncbi:acyl-CoA dehydrogenase [Nocardioides marinisabuli]|uniref:Acyl-CoA dehydrogenase n=2 Tax=Nocardioides marinisabuli TaxID=419476 RepID=A0A7Y9JQ72_9ACTN|nr:acyl-CoA dehydrogenase family protein [Nocardioides marinisabuli]NYD57160.1 acyl-CoA dehydrogenase [Nocardioides marinisabuli]
MALAELAGYHAVDVPVVEATTAAWLLERAGLPIDGAASHSIPIGPTNLVVGDDGTVSGTLIDVPWGASVDLVVAVDDDGQTVLVASSDATTRPGVDLAGQPRDTLVLEDVRPRGVATGASAEQLRHRAAALRIAQTAGALQATADLTRRYAGERVQFGRPIGAFQAVQAHVVLLEQMAVMTTGLADRLAIEPELHPFDVVAAQVVSAENAVEACRAAHQAHGAIGMTREYRLHTLTRRLHTWSGDFGETIDLSARLGATASQAPSFAQMILDDTRPELAS